MPGMDASTPRLAKRPWPISRRLGTADAADLADAEGAEVVVEHEVLAVLAPQGVDDLGVALRAQGGDHEGLGLATGKQGRAMGHAARRRCEW